MSNQPSPYSDNPNPEWIACINFLYDAGFFPLISHDEYCNPCFRIVIGKLTPESLLASESLPPMTRAEVFAFADRVKALKAFL